MIDHSEIFKKLESLKTFEEKSSFLLGQIRKHESIILYSESMDEERYQRLLAKNSEEVKQYEESIDELKTPYLSNPRSALNQILRIKNTRKVHKVVIDDLKLILKQINEENKLKNPISKKQVNPNEITAPVAAIIEYAKFSVLDKYEPVKLSNAEKIIEYYKVGGMNPTFNGRTLVSQYSKLSNDEGWKLENDKVESSRKVEERKKKVNKAIDFMQKVYPKQKKIIDYLNMKLSDISNQ